MAWTRTSRHERGYGRDHERMREHLKRTVILCEECKRNGKTKAGCIADHITPLANGGTGDRSNYAWLCSDCHDEKTKHEAAQAQGRTYRPKPRIAADGWPIED